MDFKIANLSDLGFYKLCTDIHFWLAVCFIVFILTITQMFGKFIHRYIHSSKNAWAVEKSLLATLRKKTGYTFTNCKQALEKHDNDVLKAEIWLKEQAQSLGWSKATKLQGRTTTQGLIGVLVRDNAAALVEINCETDFVARNENFREVVHDAADACVKFAKKHQYNNKISKMCLDTEQLQDLKMDEGSSLADRLALMIGTVGENAVLKRAMCFCVSPDIQISAFAHPSGEVATDTMVGRIGGLMAFKKTMQSDVDVSDVGKKLCQHIVGMSPKKIGGENDEPQKEKDEEECMIYQEYLHDDNVLVDEVLKENGIQIIDFKRFECGETANMEQPLDAVETCQ